MQSRNQMKSLTDIPLEVMEKITVDLGKNLAIDAFRMKSVFRFFNEKHAVVNKCIKMRNPNILFRNGLIMLFFLEAEHEGKTMLEEASALGHLDSTFVLGMMLMAEGRHRKQEALGMFNNAYCRAKCKWNLRATCSKVHLNLNREGRKHVHFHGFHRTCAMHKSVISVSDAFVNGYKWVFSSKNMYEAGGDPQVYRTKCIDMFEGMGPKNLKADLLIRICALHNNIEAMFRQGIDECFYYDNFDLELTLLRQAADEDHHEAIYLLGMIYISRGHHQCLQLLDVYFGWAVPGDGEYMSVVDSAKALLRAVDVVHRLTTNNITFQCKDPHHSVKGEFAIGYEEDEDRQRYCMVFR
ncbi:unnamed protein product [Lactuca saligna]|uniref:At2g35280-like TPR domain-containing protein n=1 Tax=Lactuca saligna TaxID=75948 RepID=A0AA35ZBY4_LACSI|nr:unnamed protein product [Lactuca saligna]